MERMIRPSHRGYILRRHGIALLIALFFFVLGVYLFIAGVPSSFLGSVASYALALVGLGILVFLYVLADSELHYLTTKVYLTPDGYIVYESGVLRHQKKRAGVFEVTDTASEQSILDRLVNTTTLKINTGGSMGYEIVIHDVDAHMAEMFLNEYSRLKGELAKEGRFNNPNAQDNNQNNNRNGTSQSQPPKDN